MHLVGREHVDVVVLVDLVVGFYVWWGSDYFSGQRNILVGIGAGSLQIV